MKHVMDVKEPLEGLEIMMIDENGGGGAGGDKTLIARLMEEEMFLLSVQNGPARYVFSTFILSSL